MLHAGGDTAQVGLVHNYMNYEPFTKTWAARCYLQPLCNTLQYIWGTSVLLEFFQTGKFRSACHFITGDSKFACQDIRGAITFEQQLC